MKRDYWNRCDSCGRFIAYDDFDSGAYRSMVTPDTAFTAETYETLCKRCTLLFKPEEAQERWVLDATMGCRDGLFCFCPIEGDISGDYSIVVGMNVVSEKPPGKLIAIVHADGQEAVDAFCEKYAEELLTFYPSRV